MKLSIFVLLFFSGPLSLSLVGMTSSFAQSNDCPRCIPIPPDDIDLYKELFPLTIWTDSKIYDHDSVVKITGHLRPENNIAPF